LIRLRRLPRRIQSGRRAVVPEFSGTMLQQRQQQLEYTRTQSGLASDQNAQLQNYFAGLLATPGATPQSITSAMIAHAARNPQIPAAMYTSLLQGMPQTGGKSMQQYGASMSNAARGAEATAARVQGPPGVGGAPKRQLPAPH